MTQISHFRYLSGRNGDLRGPCLSTLTAALAIRAKKEEGVRLRQPACGWVRKILYMGKAALFKYKDKKNPVTCSKME